MTKIPFISNFVNRSQDSISNINKQASKNSAAKILTTKPELAEQDEYRKIFEIVTTLINSNATLMGQGFCFSMSDVVYTMLLQAGIKSRIIECQVNIQDKVSKSTTAIGFNMGGVNPDHYDTHVIVLTETEIPLLIDLSISHRLPDPYQAVVEPADVYENRVICHIVNNVVDLVYQEKEKFTIPFLHQTSILNRIETDRKIFKDIEVLKRLNYISIFLSLFAAINVLLKIFEVW
jgi:hypothetical protein